MPANWVVIWGVAVVVFVVVESLTVGITSIWFAFGALVALIAAMLHAPEWLQVLLFILVSCGTLWLTRPLAAKYINGKKQATNADRVIGMTGRVIEKIDNVASTGAVTVGGKEWTARSQSGILIDEGTFVRAVAIDGVKLIVYPEPQQYSAEQ